MTGKSGTATPLIDKRDWQAGDMVTFVLNENDAKLLNQDCWTTLEFYRHQIIAFDPAFEVMHDN